jgi:hypothetical protein
MIRGKLDDSGKARSWKDGLRPRLANEKKPPLASANAGKWGRRKCLNSAEYWTYIETAVQILVQLAEQPAMKLAVTALSAVARNCILYST